MKYLITIAFGFIGFAQLLVAIPAITNPNNSELPALPEHQQVNNAIAHDENVGINDANVNGLPNSTPDSSLSNEYDCAVDEDCDDGDDGIVNLSDGIRSSPAELQVPLTNMLEIGVEYTQNYIMKNATEAMVFLSDTYKAHTNFLNEKLHGDNEHLLSDATQSHGSTLSDEHIVQYIGNVNICIDQVALPSLATVNSKLLEYAIKFSDNKISTAAEEIERTKKEIETLNESLKSAIEFINLPVTGKIAVVQACIEARNKAERN